MNFLSINIRGVLKQGKAGWVKSLKNVHGIDFIGLQETMVSNISKDLLSAFWRGAGYDSASIDVVGNSGGLVCLWDPKVFAKDLENKDRYFLHVSGLIMAGSVRVNLIKVYAPQSNDGKRQLWAQISIVINSNQGLWIMFGDFNAVRDREDRKNSFFDPVCARNFNDFIDDVGLREYDLKGFKYTYMSNKRGMCKFSRVDRFFVCDDLFNKWPNAYVRALKREFSDHSPLVFWVKDVNFGAKPFRMFDSWLERPECIEVINSVLGGWTNTGPTDLM